MTPRPTPAPGVSLPRAGSSAVATTADVWFAQTLIWRDRQRVAMARLAAERSTDPQVVDLAHRIQREGRSSITAMSRWLATRGRVAPRETADGAIVGGAMVGPPARGELVSRAELRGLALRSGADFDATFLSMMARHHQGTKRSAAREAVAASDPAIRRHAELVERLAGREITEMAAMTELADGRSRDLQP